MQPHRVHNRPRSSSAGPQTVQNSSHWTGRDDPMHRNRKHRIHNRPYQARGSPNRTELGKTHNHLALSSSPEWISRILYVSQKYSIGIGWCRENGSLVGWSTLAIDPELAPVDGRLRTREGNGQALPISCVWAGVLLELSSLAVRDDLARVHSRGLPPRQNPMNYTASVCSPIILHRRRHVKSFNNPSRDDMERTRALLVTTKYKNYKRTTRELTGDRTTHCPL